MWEGLAHSTALFYHVMLLKNICHCHCTAAILSLLPWLQGKCGDGRMVTASHMYKVATANREALETLSEKLTTIRRLLCDVSEALGS